MEEKSVILIGAGSRGRTYTSLMQKLGGCFRVVAVAEPLENRREDIAVRHGIDPELVYTDWKPLLARGKIADCAVICTMDRDHIAPALQAIEAGYELLLEKPIGATAEECLRIAEAAEKKGVRVLVCHVLRYTPFFIALKNLLDSGKIGRVMQVVHREDVGNVHQSHSFVRGNWGNEERSSPMLLQKSCHDLDILYWLLGKKAKKIQSFGSRSYFTAENRPEGAPDRCINGCPHADTCPYNAVKLYLEDEKNGWFRRTSTRLVEPTNADVEKTLRETNYGKCVYAVDNDVVDHQLVNIEFEDDIYVSFSMAAFNRGGREIYLMGTEGTLHGKMADDFFTYYHFGTKVTEEIKIGDALPGEMITGGHGGGDSGIVAAFYELLSGTYTGKSVAPIRDSCHSHIMAFAAEESRKEHTVVDIAAFEEKIRANFR